MITELKAIRSLLATPPSHPAGENGAIERVAAITLEEIGYPSPTAA
jgi:hypothetical protein